MLLPVRIMLSACVVQIGEKDNVDERNVYFESTSINLCKRIIICNN